MEGKNLIRFDWAIKRLLRNKANFAVLEGFLSELFKQNISIDSILESEGNQQDADDKYNRVDMLVRNSKGELLIIEIQNRNEYDFFQRMMYGASKVIAEYATMGEPYSMIKKVFSINILYFDLGQGKDYVYHGTTCFRGVHQNDTLRLSAKQKELFGQPEVYQLFPEYYVLKVNQFDGVAKDTLDEWIYYLKNNDIKEEFTAKGLAQAKQLLSLDNLTEQERKQYIRHLENLSYKASMVETWRVEAEDEVRQEERRLTNVEIVKRGLARGYSIEDLSELTGLSLEEIKKLK
ncbi:MAG: Rpn family recombination-promoting nuclease/putative transposase [Tunicatimonas sp.]